MASSSTSMPPRKKQATEQHSEEQPTPITRLLCDDLLGKVYMSCEDVATKHALRTSCSACYRSPAINSLIDTFEIGPDMTPRNTASALAAFPRLAWMRRLTIREHDMKRIFLNLLMPESAAALPKLQHVDTIQFLDCEVGTFSAAAMLTLFPVMRLDHGRIELSGNCVGGGFLAILAAHTQINEISMSSCKLGTLKELSSARSLKSLALMAIKVSNSFFLESLCSSVPSGPQLQLTKLDLSYLDNVTGLDICLECHPLQELHLIGVTFLSSLAPYVRLASPTLRVMRIRPNLTFPIISVANFSCLHKLEIDGFDLKQDPRMNAEESVRRCAHLASSLSSFPCVQCMDESDDPFCIWGSGWPPAEFMDLLQSLDPLRPCFWNVEFLNLTDTNVGSSCLSTVAALFPHLVRITMCTTEESPQHTYSDEYGLAEAVQLLPHLRVLEVMCQNPPKDVIRALAKARHLELTLVACNDGCLERLQEVQVQWDTMKMDLQDGAMLEVAPLGDYG